jgi:hypothetical protein
MGPNDPRQVVRRLLTDMLEIVDSAPDSLASRYSELRDGSYELAVQVRTAALPDIWPSREAFIKEATGRKW